MKERGIHEDCAAQVDRLYRERLYRAARGQAREAVPVDSEGRIRIDELEMGASVQAEVAQRIARIGAENLTELADVEGFRQDFLRIHGFEVEGVDYEAEVSPQGEATDAIGPRRTRGDQAEAAFPAPQLKLNLFCADRALA
jgi:enoyl-[acyl-carrier protein] reductase/trans-2-enoyl-CoA reductase (NAD+)